MAYSRCCNTGGFEENTAVQKLSKPKLPGLGAKELALLWHVLLERLSDF